MENSTRVGVPKWIWAAIIIILAGMYSYAEYFDPTRPDKTVENFYEAYFTGDYDKVASNLSVFWSVRLLPQYANMTPQELVDNRAKIEKDVSKVISEVEKNNPAPKNVKIEVLKPYTKIGNYGAIVVYDFKEKDKSQGMEASILIKENGRFRIFTMTPVDASSLDQVKAVNISDLDANFQQLLEPAE